MANTAMTERGRRVVKQYRKLKTHQLNLLQEIVAGRCPELADRVRSRDISNLSRLEREAVVDALGDELCESGLEEDDAPTPRGLAIEELIDRVLRPELID
jgi:hypothetical protein